MAKYWKRLSHEQELWAKGVSVIAGVDEAGCGPLAGPVVAAAVVFPCTWLQTGLHAKLRGLDDSKQLTEEQREKFYAVLTAHADIRYAIAAVDVEMIDQINIYQAAHRAMNLALAQLQPAAEHVLVDGRPVKSLPIPHTPLIKGDCKSYKDIRNLQLGADDGEIGRVKDLYFDDENWAIRYLVADTGKWLPGRQVLISPASADLIDTEHNVVKVNLSRRQIEAAPSIDHDKPVSRQHEVDYAHYYGWPMYWYGPALWGATAYPVYERAPDEPPTRDPLVHPEQTGDPHLRSATEVVGYYIHAQDDDIGHVEDIIFDDQDWAIRYLEVDTRNWLPGKKVLVAPEWIQEVSWERSRVTVDLTADAIRNAPEYENAQSITREYEEKLYEHYQREAYWNRRREILTQ